VIKRNIGIAAWLLILSMLLFYPLVWLKPVLPVYHVYILRFFTPAWMALLALLIAFYYYDLAGRVLRQWWIGWPMLIMGIQAVIQIFWWGNDYNFEALLLGMFWLTIPLAAAICAVELEKKICWAGLIFWLGSVAISSRELLDPRTLLYGIPGNYNWNATLLAVSGLLTILLVVGPSSITPASWHRRLIAFFAGVFTMFLIYHCNCKGAVLIITLVALLFYWLECPRVRKYLIIAAILLLALIIYKYSAITAAFNGMDHGIRSGLWSGTLKTIQENWWNGTSAAGFETCFAGTMPRDYYLSQWAAVRSNHPHNQILYQFAVWGIAGGIAWLLMILTPLFLFFRRYSQRRRMDKVYVAAMLIIFGHGMIDLTLFEWPTNLFFLFFTGILWHRVTTAPSEEPAAAEKCVLPTRMIRVVALLAGLFILGDGLYRTLRGTYYFRSAEFAANQHNPTMTAYLYDLGLTYLPDNPEYLYKAGGHAMVFLKNPDLALNYFRQIDGLNRNYAQNNGFIGQLLLDQGHPGEALPYLEANVNNYPYNVVPHFYYSIALDRLGRKEEATREFRLVYELLRVRGLETRHLPFLLRNTYYDRRWHEIPDEIRQLP